jgi:hypothetical protein
VQHQASIEHVRYELLFSPLPSGSIETAIAGDHDQVTISSQSSGELFDGLRVLALQENRDED